MNKIAIAGAFVIGLVIGLAACTDEADPLGVTAHPEGWLETASDNFHGQFVLQSAKNAESCATCHSEDYTGGTSGVSCLASGCHPAYPHADGFINEQSPNFHGAFIAERNLWDLTVCQDCHGTDYAGMGDAEKNCLNCHNEDDGPEACMTCHGNEASIGPPPDVLGNTSSSLQSVGAHLPHTGEKRWTTAMTPECSQCHTVPRTHQAPGHVDDAPPIRAEINFKLLATHDGRVTPVWNVEAATCSDVYCHGGFTFRQDESAFPWAYTDAVMTGNNPTVTWTDVGSGAADCGTCHDLPPTGHIDAAESECADCHSSVVDANLTIIDRGKHINGDVEVDPGITEPRPNR